MGLIWIPTSRRCAVGLGGYRDDKAAGGVGHDFCTSGMKGLQANNKSYKRAQNTETSHQVRHKIIESGVANLLQMSVTYLQLDRSA